MSKALYRKYRSKSLDEVIGQKHITDILKNAISQDRVSHAYLFTGPRGVGKTSIARILAHEINKLPYEEGSTHLDIIEIDAASNNGVEDVRDLREKVLIAPAAANKKIYIIDEVHMLSKAAFNALLKTLEEPPSHIVFILATTNIEKLPATIVSRTQRFAFRPIGIIDAVAHLKNIAKQESINISDEALTIIAKRGDGSFRDSISLLDQLSSLVNDKEEITPKLIEDMLGLAPNKMIENIISAVEKNSLDSILKELDRANNEGISADIITQQLINNIRTDIGNNNHLLPLLDSLVDIARSTQLQHKLLTTLGKFASQRQPVKNVTLLAPTSEVSVSISELEKQAVVDKPSEKKVQAAVKTNNTKKRKSNKKIVPADFEWNKLIKYVQANHVALYSVLSKCGYEVTDEGLTLYTCNAFYKKKLDDPKYSPLICKSLQEVGYGGLDIHTIPTTCPPKDSQAAAVAAIMGGGEEVSVESL